MQSKNKKLELWKQRHQAYQKSGLSRKAFCEKNKLKKQSSRSRKKAREGRSESGSLPDGFKCAISIGQKCVFFDHC
jgi:hypothetical protein